MNKLSKLSKLSELFYNRIIKRAELSESELIEQWKADPSDVGVMEALAKLTNNQEILTELYKSQNPMVQYWVVEKTNNPEVIRDAASSTDYRIKHMLSRNHNVDSTLLENIYDTWLIPGTDNIKSRLDYINEGHGGKFREVIDNLIQSALRNQTPSKKAEELMFLNHHLEYLAEYVKLPEVDAKDITRRYIDSQFRLADEAEKDRKRQGKRKVRRKKHRGTNISEGNPDINGDLFVEFALNVPGADIAELENAVIASGDEMAMYRFSTKVPGSTIKFDPDKEEALRNF